MDGDFDLDPFQVYSHRYFDKPYPGVSLQVRCDGNVITADLAETIKADLEMDLENCDAGSPVTKFDMSSRTWPAESIETLSPFLKEKVVPTVKYLNISSVIASLETDDGFKTLKTIADIFKDAPYLERLDCSGNAPGIRAWKVMDPLFHMVSLKHIFASNVGFDSDSAQQLAATFTPEWCTWCPLESLDVDRNEIGRRGYAEIAKIVKKSSNIEYFRAKKGTEAVVDALHEVSVLLGTNHLKVLELREMKFRNQVVPIQSFVDHFLPS